MSFVFLTLLGQLARGEDAKSEIWQNIKSPVTTDAKYSLISGSALTLVLVAFEEQIVEPVQEQTVRDKALGSASKWGDRLGQLYPNGAYVLGMWGYGKWTKNHEALRDASLMFQATLYSALVTTTLKYTVREERPNHSARNSFPSGHTLFATVLCGIAAHLVLRHWRRSAR